MRCIRTCCVVFAAIAIAGSALAQVTQSEDRPEDHAALRSMLVKGAEALNTHNFDGMAPSLHRNFTIITVDNQKFVGVDAFKKYYLGLFEGPNATLNKIDVHMTADETTRFLDDNTGIVYGSSDDTFHFKDGDVRAMHTRWSAVTQKESDGWKLVNVHFSANVLDNPIVEATKSFAKKIATGGVVVGLLIGLLVMLLLHRRSRT